MRPIDADTLFKQLAEIAHRANENAAYTGNRDSGLTWDIAVEHIKNAPTLDVIEQKKGKWVQNDNGTWLCSLCQSWIPNEHHYYAKYCPHCGADMRGEKQDG